MIKKTEDNKYILKTLGYNGEVKTYVVLPLDEYIEKLEEAYRDGSKEIGRNS